jgi:homogentisate 1,2-dioxygenase
MLDWHPQAIPVPYNHSNLQSEEMIYYVDGKFGSRPGVGVGAITLHPSGLPHGPAPGVAERSIGQRFTEELAVTCDTFRPLKLTGLAREIDDGGEYALQWAREAAHV